MHELNQNGTLKRDVENNPIPSYGQKEIKAFARVFTGWVYHGNNGKYGVGATVNPMIAIDEDHDTDEKILLDHVLPGGQAAGSPNNIGNAILPKYATDQYGATLAKWMGVVIRTYIQSSQIWVILLSRI